MFEYRCHIDRVVDGDTVEARIDLGFSCFYHSPIRLTGINAPERKGATRAAAEEARGFLATQLARGPVVVVTELRKDKEKYGRVLGTLFVNGVNVNQVMVDTGHAVPYLA